MAYDSSKDRNRVPDLAEQPAEYAVAITPDNSNDLAIYAKSLYVGGAGNISLVTKRGTANVTFTAVPAGTILPVQVSRVNATGTTATAIVALY
jgi:hypothetical protein